MMRGGSWLDVGCASGLFLERVSDAGWRVTGIEPSLSLRRYAEQKLSKGTWMICGTLESAEVEPGSCDVVGMCPFAEGSMGWMSVTGQRIAQKRR
jgi:2-polyprenyl-3-methyl-5-hydroxy-6-metoxy-1,4-benzoquinol methylase